MRHCVTYHQCNGAQRLKKLFCECCSSIGCCNHFGRLQSNSYLKTNEWDLSPENALLVGFVQGSAVEKRLSSYTGTMCCCWLLPKYSCVQRRERARFHQKGSSGKGMNWAWDHHGNKDLHRAQGNVGGRFMLKCSKVEGITLRCLLVFFCIFFFSGDSRGVGPNTHSNTHYITGINS